MFDLTIYYPNLPNLPHPKIYYPTPAYSTSQCLTKRTPPYLVAKRSDTLAFTMELRIVAILAEYQSVLSLTLNSTLAVGITAVEIAAVGIMVQKCQFSCVY